MLAKYNNIVPGAAERILRMAELESEHRRSLDRDAVAERKRVISLTGRDVLIGQLCAVIIALAFIALAAYNVHEGHEVAGTVAGLPGIAAIVLAFIVGRSKKGNDAGKG